MKPKAIIELREGEKVEVQVIYKTFPERPLLHTRTGPEKEVRKIYELYPRMCGYLHVERMEK